MKIREANIGDLDKILDLFYDAIITIGRDDYSEEQINAWISSRNNRNKWIEKIRNQYFVVAEHEQQIIGFGSLEGGDYIDLLYVHSDFQRQGIAKLLIDELEYESKSLGKNSLFANVSITALPFFEKQGFKVEKEQKNLLEGVELVNYRMVKNFQ